MKTKRIVVALLCTMVCSITVAQTGRDLNDDGLQGTVKRVISKMYEARYNDADSLTVGEQLEHLITEYNARGQRRQQVYLSVAEDVIFRTRYKHDGFGLTTLEHIVDNQDRVIGRTYYLYDADHSLTETYVEDAERQIESRILFKHDAQGRVSQRSFNDPRNEIFKREVCTYNANGTISRAIVYDRTKQRVQEKRWEYDAHGYPISYTLYDYTEDEPEMFITIYEREYDAHGNWVRCNEFEIIGDRRYPTYTTVREIDYF